VSPLETLRGILAEEYEAGNWREQLWRNGARFPGYIARPKDAGDWSDRARSRFVESWKGLYTGDGPGAGGTPVLEDGMTFQATGITPEQAQYLETRKLTREEVAAAFHIPLPMVGILDHATFSNIKEQHQQLYQDTLGPWLSMIAEDLMLQLLPDLDGSADVYLEFNLAEKMRGSFEEQAATMQTATGGPWMTRNEARARVNLPAIDGADELGGAPERHRRRTSIPDGFRAEVGCCSGEVVHRAAGPGARDRTRTGPGPLDHRTNRRSDCADGGQMMIKTATAQIKATGPDDGLGEMQFTGYASVFGNKDSYGDVVEPGAFTDTLAKWQTSSEVIPCLWGHDMLDPESNIGHVLEASQDSRGLLVKVQLDPESDRAKTVYRLLKGRRVGDMSFAYEVQDSAWAKSDDLGDYQALRKLHLFEVSVVGIGANQEAEILTVKTAAAMLADGVKAGRVISAKNESSLRVCSGRDRRGPVQPRGFRQ
jgi:HK97 family phage prohead protease